MMGMAPTDPSTGVKVDGGDAEIHKRLVSVHDFGLQQLVELAVVAVDVLVHPDAGEPVLDVQKRGVDVAFHCRPILGNLLALCVSCLLRAILAISGSDNPIS